jgi:membrane protein
MDGIKNRLGAINDWLIEHRTTRVARRAVLAFMNHNALQFAGSMAYFAVLSVFQLLVLGVVVFSFFMGQGEARNFIVEQVEAGSPLDAEIVTGVIDSIIESRGGITIISFGFLTWSALGVFSAMSTGIMRAFEQAEPRPFWKDKLLGLFLMAITGSLIVASVVIGIVTGIVQNLADDVLPWLPADPLVAAIGLVVPLLLIFVVFWVIYRVVPNRPVTWMEVLPGAVVAAILWTILRFGFTWYATSVANYESAFGPISTGVTLLVFLYFASIIILLGAEMARASVIDDEMAKSGAEISQADPRLLPVPVDPVQEPAPPPKRGVPRLAVLAGGALLGVVIGRLTKRDEDEY